MAALLLENLKQRISSLTLEPSGGGCFEVFVGAEQIYSKLETGEFPAEAELLTALEGRVV